MPTDSTVKDLENLHRQAKTARNRLAGTWWMNLSYYNNEQWLAWDGTRLYRPQLSKSRITIVDNRITPCVRTELAKLTKNRPVFTVTPRTGDEEDANASELAEQLMRYLWTHLNLHELRYKALEWSRICGAGFLKCFWDPSKGEGTDVLVGPGGQVLTDANQRPMRADQHDPRMLSQQLGVLVKAKKVSQGDIVVEARSPFQMFPDPLADTFEECEWVIEESVKSTEYVRRRFDTDVEADTPANPGLVQAQLGGGTSAGGGTGGYKGVKVYEYWCKPNSTHPSGRRVVWCKGQILFEGDGPFDPLPYVMFSGIPTPGRLWPMSIVEHLRGPQTELNKVKSQIAENRNRVGNPTILASKQAVQDPEKFLDSMTMPGGTYFFDDLGSPNAVPQFLQPPQLPNYVLEEIDRIEKSIQEISGQHEVTSANVPPGVTAASAINLLQEADDTRMGPSVTDHEIQLGKLGQKILKLAAHYYTDARTIRIAGDNGEWEIFDFRGSMLRDNTHVEVQAGSAFPHSKAAKQAWIQDMLTFFVQSGNPPHGKQLAQFLKNAEIGGAEKLVQDYTDDQSQINREHSKLLQGEPVLVNNYDNDQIHIDGHETEQKSQRYERQPPQVKAVFEQHVQAHRDRMAAQQQAQMQLQMNMQNGGPQPDPQQAQAQQQAQQQQQMQLQAAQAQQQQAGQAAQTSQQLGQREDEHQQQLRHQQEQHEARLLQMRQQARQQGGRR